MATDPNPLGTSVDSAHEVNQHSESRLKLTAYLSANAWQIVHQNLTPAIPPEFRAIGDLPIGSLARNLLSHYGQGIYQHQYKAIAAYLGGQNVCMTTPTASGKSLVFYVCGAESLQRKPSGTILAIYPLKALTDEQEMKWRQAMEQTGTTVKVGRIDGSVQQSQRKKIITESSVVIMTPDVIHAWLMSNLGERGIRNFLANLQTIVIDEAHTYSGVFGSNAAYLFRRLHHSATKLGATPRYIAASATINNPLVHLRNLTGANFKLVGRDEDSAGHRARHLLLANPPTDMDWMTALTELMHHITQATDHQFITFVDSRKQTEQLATVMRRVHEPTPEEDDLNLDVLERLQVYPFRAGYEAHDRKLIQDRLRNGEVRGVISTSALEMGIDIPGLTLGILVGVPYSATSYYQRIGRVGRHADGIILVVGNGSIVSNRIMRQPELLNDMPLAESTLYLENPRIQYIHAMCLARPGGEDETLSGNDASQGLCFHAAFPPSFEALCYQEHVGEVEASFHAMKLEAGTNPNYAFPLRDCEVQYRVETLEHVGPKRELGTLSFSQVMREAYPGAVYYYQTQAFRVVRILFRQHIILVRPERRYTTKPSSIPALIFPNMSPGNVYGALRFHDLQIAETNLQLKETIIGFKERRGPNEFAVSYPLDRNLGLYFDSPRFERNYFSSGVLLSHPSLENNGVQRELLSEILFEAFLLQVPFERQDLNVGTDRFRVSRGDYSEDTHFICIYDQTYGSLRLSSRLMEPEVLRGVLEKALDIATNDSAFEVSAPTLVALQDLCTASATHPVQNDIQDEIDIPLENRVQVIAPGSVGLYPDYHNEEFHVEDVVFTPKGLVYRGKRMSQVGERFETVVVTAPVDKIVAIPGLTELGWYDYDTGEVAV